MGTRLTHDDQALGDAQYDRIAAPPYAYPAPAPALATNHLKTIFKDVASLSRIESFTLAVSSLFHIPPTAIAVVLTRSIAATGRALQAVVLDASGAPPRACGEACTPPPSAPGIVLYRAEYQESAAGGTRGEAAGDEEDARAALRALMANVEEEAQAAWGGSPSLWTSDAGLLRPPGHCTQLRMPATEAVLNSVAAPGRGGKAAAPAAGEGAVV